MTSPADRLRWGRLEGRIVVPISFEEYIAYSRERAEYESKHEDGWLWRRVGFDKFPEHHIYVSTVFLYGIDHGFLGPPKWFETMARCSHPWHDEDRICFNRSLRKNRGKPFDQWGPPEHPPEPCPGVLHKLSDLDEVETRYTTYDEAEAGHAQVVAAVKAALAV